MAIDIVEKKIVCCEDGEFAGIHYRRNAVCKMSGLPCRLATIWNGVLYCGQVSGENRVLFMSSCPILKTNGEKI
jgi:hypothetical protein